MHNGQYEIIKDWDKVKYLVAKYEVTSVFGACIVYGPLGGVVMIQEREKPRWRFPGGGIRLETETIREGVLREVAEEAEHHIDVSQLQFVVAFLTDDRKGEGAHLRVFFSYELHHGWREVSDQELASLRSRGFDIIERWGMFYPYFVETEEGRSCVEFEIGTIMPPFEEEVWVSGFHMRALRHLMRREKGSFMELPKLIATETMRVSV